MVQRYEWPPRLCFNPKQWIPFFWFCHPCCISQARPSSTTCSRHLIAAAWPCIACTSALPWTLFQEPWPGGSNGNSNGGGGGVGSKGNSDGSSNNGDDGDNGGSWDSDGDGDRDDSGNYEDDGHDNNDTTVEAVRAARATKTTTVTAMGGGHKQPSTKC